MYIVLDCQRLTFIRNGNRVIRNCNLIYEMCMRERERERDICVRERERYICVRERERYMRERERDMREREREMFL